MQIVTEKHINKVCIDGIKGLYKYILEAMHVESPFNCVTWSILAKIGNITE